MRVHEFTVILSGITEVTDEAADALFEAGCDDGSFASRDGVAFVMFHRQAESLREAIDSAIAGVRNAGFVVPRNLGVVSGADGMMRLSPGTVRIPDVAFIAWDRFPNGKLTGEPIPHFAPDLAVEVPSASSTADEMSRKRSEYFEAGTKLLWIVDPRKRSVTVCRSIDDSWTLTQSDTLDGGDVLPGFALSLGNLFSELDRVGRA